MAGRVAVIGAGNGGHALAAQMALNGHEVIVYEHPDFAKNLEGIKDRGGIEVIDKMTKDGIEIKGAMGGFGKVAAVTTDMGRACEADVVMMVVPSFGQEPMFHNLLPHLRHGHTLVLLPGNFGSLILKRILREKGVNLDLAMAETNTIPHACRIVGPGQVFIGGVKDRLGMAVLPAGWKEETLAKIEQVFPIGVYALDNVAAAGLNNPNMVAHVPTAVLNMGLAESRGGQFYFYKEGMSESVSKVQQAVDDERVAVGRALGVSMLTFVEIVNVFYKLKVKSIHDFATTTPVHNAFGHDFPKSPRERYVSEDAPFLLTPVFSFAQALGLPAPATQSIIRIASIMNDTDYFTDGRTLEKMGLAGLTPREIKEYVS